MLMSLKLLRSSSVLTSPHTLSEPLFKKWKGIRLCRLLEQNISQESIEKTKNFGR
jgi:hypothetical protein